MFKKTKKTICLIAIPAILLANLLPSTISHADVGDNMRNVPYWSDSVYENALMQQTLDQIFGNDELGIKGAEKLYQESLQIASTIENDVMQIVKNTDGSDSTEAIDRLVAQMSNPDDADNPGIIDQLQSLYDAWTINPITDPDDPNYAQPIDDPDDRLTTAELYYKTEAKLSYPVGATNLGEVIDQMVMRIDNYDPSDQELLTEFENPTTGETETLAEYTPAARDLHDIVTSDKSLITGKDYAYWGNTNEITLVELTDFFRQLAYIRAQAVYQKYKDHIEEDLSLTYSLHSEISDITGTISASPYDMGTIMQTIEEKIYTLYALANLHANLDPANGGIDDNGFDGMANAKPAGATKSYPDIEPMDYRDYDTMRADIDDLLGKAQAAVQGYKGKYEQNPNLSDSETYGAFENARKAIINLRDSTLRHVLELSDVLESRLEDANLKLDLLAEKIESVASSSGAGSQIWTEIKNALVKIVNWLLSTFGRLLNYGMNELNEIGSLKDIHAITVGFANMGFLLMLTFAGLAISMEWNTSAYNIKRLIPRFVASVIIVNFSLVIAQFFTDLALIVTNVFLTQAGKIVDANLELFSRTGLNTLGLSAGAPTLLFGSLLSSDFVSISNSLFSNDLVSLIILILVFIVTAAVDILLVIRSAGIWLLAIVAPIVFLLWLLPTTQSFFRSWWKQFFRLVVIGPLVSIIFLIGISLARIGIADDFLRVLIGIGTFGLILASPSFMNFFSISLKSTNKKESSNVQQKFYQRQAASPAVPGATPQIPNQPNAGDGNKKAPSADYMQQIRNIISPSSPEVKVEQSIADLEAPAITNVILTGGLKSAEGPELANLFKRLNEKQQDALLATLDMKGLDGETLWSQSQKGVVEKIVPPARIEKARRHTRPLPKTAQEKLNVAELIKKNQQAAHTPAPTLSMKVIQSLLGESRFDDLKKRLSDLDKQNGLAPKLLDGLFKIKQSLSFLGSLLANPYPEDQKLATNIISRYYQNQPQKIVDLTPHLADKNVQTAEASTRVLKVGIEALGTALVENPEDPNLKEAAKRLVTQIPEYLVEMLAGVDAKRAPREQFISAGIDQIPEANLTVSSLVANLEKADLMALSDNIAIPGLTSIIQNSPSELTPAHIDKIIGNLATNQDQYLPLLKGVMAQISGKDGSPVLKTETIQKIKENQQTIERFIPSNAAEVTAKKDEAPLVRAEIPGSLDLLAPREVNQFLQQSPSQISSAEIGKLVADMQTNPLDYRDIVKSLAENYNQNLGRFGQPTTLSPEAAQQLAQYAQELQKQGIVLKQTEGQITPLKPALERIVSTPIEQIPQIKDEIFIPAITPLVQLSPQMIVPEHMAKALQGLKQDPGKFTSVVYSLLSPAAGIPENVWTYGLRQLAHQKPELVLPDHVDKTFDGLEKNQQIYLPTAEDLVRLYNQANGSYGQPGQFSLPATTQLAVRAQDFADSLPPLTLIPFPPTDDELSAQIVSRIAPDTLEHLPQQLMLTGLSVLMQNHPKDLTPDHILGMLRAAKDNPEAYTPLLKGLAAKFDQTNLEHANYPLGLGTLMALAAGQDELKEFGIELDQNAVNDVSKLAGDNGIDFKSFDSMEKAIREIPRALKPPPGRAGGDQPTAKVTTIKETTVKESAVPAAKKDMTRENLAHEDITNKLAHEDLNDYASNLKSDQAVGIIRPEN